MLPYPTLRLRLLRFADNISIPNSKRQQELGSGTPATRKPMLGLLRRYRYFDSYAHAVCQPGMQANSTLLISVNSRLQERQRFLHQPKADR